MSRRREAADLARALLLSTQQEARLARSSPPAQNTHTHGHSSSSSGAASRSTATADSREYELQAVGAHVEPVGMRGGVEPFGLEGEVRGLGQWGDGIGGGTSGGVGAGVRKTADNTVVTAGTGSGSGSKPKSTIEPFSSDSAGRSDRVKSVQESGDAMNSPIQTFDTTAPYPLNHPTNPFPPPSLPHLPLPLPLPHVPRLPQTPTHTHSLPRQTPHLPSAPSSAHALPSDRITSRRDAEPGMDNVGDRLDTSSDPDTPSRHLFSPTQVSLPGGPPSSAPRPHDTPAPASRARTAQGDLRSTAAGSAAASMSAAPAPMPRKPTTYSRATTDAARRRSPEKRELQGERADAPIEIASSPPKNAGRVTGRGPPGVKRGHSELSSSEEEEEVEEGQGPQRRRVPPQASARGSALALEVVIPSRQPSVARIVSDSDAQSVRGAMNDVPPKTPAPRLVGRAVRTRSPARTGTDTTRYSDARDASPDPLAMSPVLGKKDKRPPTKAKSAGIDGVKASAKPASKGGRTLGDAASAAPAIDNGKSSDHAARNKSRTPSISVSGVSGVSAAGGSASVFAPVRVSRRQADNKAREEAEREARRAKRRAEKEAEKARLQKDEKENREGSGMGRSERARAREGADVSVPKTTSRSASRAALPDSTRSAALVPAGRGAVSSTTERSPRAERAAGRMGAARVEESTRTRPRRESGAGVSGATRDQADSKDDDPRASATPALTESREASAIPPDGTVGQLDQPVSAGEVIPPAAVVMPVAPRSATQRVKEKDAAAKAATQKSKKAEKKTVGKGKKRWVVEDSDGEDGVIVPDVPGQPAEAEADAGIKKGSRDSVSGEKRDEHGNEQAEDEAEEGEMVTDPKQRSPLQAVPARLNAAAAGTLASAEAGPSTPRTPFGASTPHSAAGSSVAKSAVGTPGPGGHKWRTERSDLASVLSKFGGSKFTGMSRKTRIVPLHTKIGPPKKALPPAPVRKEKRKKGESEDEDEDEEEAEGGEGGERKKKSKEKGIEWFMMED